MLRQGHVLDVSAPVVLQCLGQCAVTGLTGSVFGAVTCGMCGVHALHHQWHVKTLTQGRAVRLKTIGSSLQPVVHMHRMHPVRPTDGAGKQQSSGVSPTAQRNGKRAKVLERVQGGEVSGRQLWCR